MLPFDFVLPETIPPGWDLHLRARLDDRTAVIRPLRVPSPLRTKLDMPEVWHEGAEGVIRVLVQNAGDVAVKAVEVSIEAPYALSVERGRAARFDALAPGEEREFGFLARAMVALESGSLHVAIASSNGGGLKLRQPFRIEGCPAGVEARPAFRLPERRASATPKPRSKKRASATRR